jgi:uncharacterized membrane protein YqjE
MSPELTFALKRSALVFAALAIPLFAVGVAWAVVDHHRVGFCIAVLYYIAGGGLAMYGTFSKSASRKEYRQLTIEQRRAAFSTQMWLVLIALVLVAAGVLAQTLL